MDSFGGGSVGGSGGGPVLLVASAVVEEGGAFFLALPGLPLAVLAMLRSKGKLMGAIGRWVIG